MKKLSLIILVLLTHSLLAATNPGRFLDPRLVAGMRVLTNHPTVMLNNHAQVPLALLKKPEDYRVLVQEGNTTKPASGALNVSGSSTNLSIELNKLYVVSAKTPETTSTRRSTNHVLAKSLLVKALPATTPGGAPQTFSGTLRLAARQSPIPWVNGKYSTKLLIGFDADSAEQARRFLPLTVQLLRTHVDELTPETVTIEKHGREGDKDVVVSLSKYVRDAKVTALYANTEESVPLVVEGFGDVLQGILPLPVLIASAIGGFVGGLLRMFKEKKRSGKRTLWLVTEGVVVGVVVASLLVAGLLKEWIPVESGAGLVVPFAVAALAGSVGTHFIDRFLPKKSNA